MHLASGPEHPDFTVTVAASALGVRTRRVTDHRRVRGQPRGEVRDEKVGDGSVVIDGAAAVQLDVAVARESVVLDLVEGAEERGLQLVEVVRDELGGRARVPRTAEASLREDAPEDESLRRGEREVVGSATRAERSADVTGGDKATLTELRGERKDAASALDDAERALADAFLFTALDLPRPKRGAPARVETGDSAPDAGIVSEDLTAGW